MERKTIYADGTPVPGSYCIMPDHFVTTVQVTLRSLQPIKLDILKSLIQQKHEVTGMAATEEVCVVRNVRHVDT